MIFITLIKCMVRNSTLISTCDGLLCMYVLLLITEKYLCVLLHTHSMQSTLCIVVQIIVLSKKERRDRRRQQRGDYELTIEAKNSWERLRRHQLPNTERKQLMDKLLTAITGQIHQVHTEYNVHSSLMYPGLTMLSVTNFWISTADYFPSGFQEIYQSLVELYVPQIIELMDNEVMPDINCHGLNFCRKDTGQFCHVFCMRNMGRPAYKASTYIHSRIH